MSGQEKRGVLQEPLDIAVAENQLQVPDITDLCRFLQMSSASLDLITVRSDAGLPPPLDRLTVAAKNEAGRLDLSTSAVLTPDSAETTLTALRKHLLSGGAPAEGGLPHPVLHGYEQKEKPRPSSGVVVFKAPVSGLKVAISAPSGQERDRCIEVTNRLTVPSHARGRRYGRFIIKPRHVADLNTEKYVTDFLEFSLITLSALVGYIDRSKRLPLLTTEPVPGITEVPKPKIVDKKSTPKSRKKGSPHRKTPAPSSRRFRGMPESEKVREPETALPRLSDIGGYEGVKDAVREVVAAFRHPEIAEMWDNPVARRVLLYGPHGTGKTTIAKTFASELGASLRMVDSTEIMDMYVSNSGRNMKEFFDELRGVTEPTVAVFDEFEKIVNTKGSAERVEAAGVFQREVQTITRDNEHVMLIATINDKDSVDPALIRPGRFDRLIYVGLPDAEARRQIWLKYITPLYAKTSDNFRPFGDMDHDELNASIEALVLRSDGCTGADIEIAFQELRSKKMSEHIRNGQFTPIDSTQLLEALNSFRQQ